MNELIDSFPYLVPQRRQWLQEAMSAACRGQREEVEQMKNCLRVLSQPTPASASEAELAVDQQEREGALELLADLCENMDNAAGTPTLPPPHAYPPPAPAAGAPSASRSPSCLASLLGWAAAQPSALVLAFCPASRPPACPPAVRL